MAQWDIYPNPVPRARERMPYLVVLQSDLLSALPTRLVAPLSRSGVTRGELPQRIAPEFEVAGERLVLKPHEAGSVDARTLRDPVANLRAQSHRLVDALDAVISGI
jgi:toxin CcdB